MNIWQSVQVKAQKSNGSDSDHPRAGQAGVVFAINPEKPDEVGVRFDIDSVVELVQVADLVRL